LGDSLEYGPVVVKVNLVSEYTEESLSDILKDASVLHANKKIKNVLATLVPESFVSVVLDIAGIDLNKTCNTLTRTERHILTQTLRGLPLTVDSLLGPDKAIIASGGCRYKRNRFQDHEVSII
jgi:predicted flavoprotein YhiN